MLTSPDQSLEMDVSAGAFEVQVTRRAYGGKVIIIRYSCTAQVPQRRM